MSERLRRYAAELAAELPADLADPERVVAEVEDHLAQSLEALSREMTPSAAEEEVIRRFGRPADVAALFAALAGAEPSLLRARWRGRTAAAAGLAAAVGLVAFAAWTLVDPAPVAWRWARAIATAAAGMLAIGLAVLQITDAWGAAVVRRVVAVTSATIVLVGVAAVAGTLELGRLSGDYECYGVAIGAALIVQGGLGLSMLSRRVTRARA